MPEGYRIVDSMPTAEQLLSLRASVGWSQYDVSAMQSGLAGSLFAVCAWAGNEIVGSARVVGDGRTVFYIQDVIVRPEHQGCGLGAAMLARVMAYIDGAACERAVVGLMAAKGKEAFYEKFGFTARPNERDGAGMMQRWKAGH